MPDDDLDPSLSDRIRSLPPHSPEPWREVLLELAERVEEATAVEEVLRRAGGAPYRTRPSPKHKRDRHGMYGIKGGLAAFAPLAPMAFLFHDGVVPVAATVGRSALRLACRSRHTQAAALVLAVSTGAALLMPGIGAFDLTHAGAQQGSAGTVVDRDRHHAPGLRPQAPARKRRRSDREADALRAHHDRDDTRRHVPAGFRRTSSVRNPGPRRDAGRTVTWKHAPTRARRVAKGSASNSCSLMPAWASSSLPCASRPASSRSSARRWSMPSRRASSRCRRSLLAGSAMAASASPRWVASAANWAARPVARGTWPAGLPSWLRRSTVRVVT